MTDRSFNIFFDMGAWQGYSLPRVGDAGTGFSGPFVHSLGSGQWAGVRFAALTLRDAGGKSDIALKEVASHAMPGALERVFSANDLRVRQTLFFADSWHALVRIELSADKARDIELADQRKAMPLVGAHLTGDGDTVTQGFAHSPSMLTTQLHAGGAVADRVSVSGNNYRIALDKPLHLEAGKPVTLYVVQTLRLDAHAEPPVIDYAHAWDANRSRWAGYLKSVATRPPRRSARRRGTTRGCKSRRHPDRQLARGAWRPASRRRHPLVLQPRLQRLLGMGFVEARGRAGLV